MEIWVFWVGRPWRPTFNHRGNAASVTHFGGVKGLKRMIVEDLSKAQRCGNPLALGLRGWSHQVSRSRLPRLMACQEFRCPQYGQSHADVAGSISQ